jgi:hypothetical protein
MFIKINMSILKEMSKYISVKRLKENKDKNKIAKKNIHLLNLF